MKTTGLDACRAGLTLFAKRANISSLRPPDACATKLKGVLAMRSARPLQVSILSLLVTFFLPNMVVRADDEYTDDYDVKARVVRISLIDGEVNLKRNGN